MGPLQVVDDPGAPAEMRGIGPEAPAGAQLAPSGLHGERPVRPGIDPGGGEDAVGGHPAGKRPIGLPPGVAAAVPDAELIDDGGLAQDDGILGAAKHLEHLEKPVFAGGIGVPVVPGGRLDGVELE